MSLLLPGGAVSKQKLIGKSNSRKSKSPIPGQGYLGTERPSSVSSVHSEGDYHRQTPVWAWEDRPSSTGEEWASFRGMCRELRCCAVTLDIGQKFPACGGSLKWIFC